MKKGVLITGYTYNLGGTERTIINLLDILKDQYFFDFIYSENSQKLANYEFLESNSSSFFPLNLKVRGRLFAFLKEVDTFFRNNYEKYNAIIVNYGDVFDSIFLYYAKKYKIKNRISYAHMGEYKVSNFFYKLRNHFAKKIAHKHSTAFFASSKKAAEATFLKKDVKRTKLFTCINFANYTFDEQERQKIRERYEINNSSFVIGSVASISENKNQKYLINVFKSLVDGYKGKKPLYLVLVGNCVNSDYYHQIDNEIQLFNKNHDSKILVISNIEVNRSIYSMFDVFCLFSKNESFGQSLIESAINGLQSFVLKDAIPDYVTHACQSITLPGDDFDFCSTVLQEFVDKERDKTQMIKSTSDLVTDDLRNYL